MTPEEHQQQKKAAREFVAYWQKEAKGSEKAQSRGFWTDLYSSVFGIPHPDRGVLEFEYFVQGRYIDVFHEDVGVLIEQKSRGVNLDTPERRGRDKNGAYRYETPYEQAKWYADNLPRSQSPRWLIVSNFDEIRIHDLNKLNPATDYETLRLEELPDQLHRLSFLTRKENSRQEREKQLSVAVGDPIRRLYDELAKGFEHLPANQHELRCLNILLTRIVFLLYAEDADLLPEHGAFTNYLSDCKA
ncbi:MAG: hypothetical protein J6T92_05000, partial [Ottowia sp.]|nr:hypothetical protein [Ottowia sp.]